MSFRVLRLLITSFTVALAVCAFSTVRQKEASFEAQFRASAKIRGAIYIPSQDYNAPQLWKNFNLAETRRDFGYARTIHLNALRIWASYEFWLLHPHRFNREFSQMLRIAHSDGIRVLVSLFETDGVAPTSQNMWTTDPSKAFDIQSPGFKIAASKNHRL